MLLEKIRKFWKAGLAETNKIPSFLLSISIISLMITGCGDELPEVSEVRETVVDQVHPANEDDFDDAVSIAAVYRDIYDEAVETNALSSLEIMRRIIARLGENGYVAVDSENQIDMVGAEQALMFCEAVDKKEKGKLTIIVITDLGFRKFDMETEEGNVNIVSGYYQYDQNGQIQNESTVNYKADIWRYTEEGYLLFAGSYFSDELFVLTLSDVQEYTALRILPLDETCRELNRKYIQPVGYEQNNMFLIDWSEENFGYLDFYDMFDIFYPFIYGQNVPYTADENLGVGAVYRIPKEEFETVLMTYFDIDSATLQSKTTYFPEDETYEYKPRGFYEVEYPEIPYPEVVDYSENADGTLTLIVNVVFPEQLTSKVYVHGVVIRPLADGGFQYVSNYIIPSDDNYEETWHTPRLTEEEWKEYYGESK